MVMYDRFIQPIVMHCLCFLNAEDQSGTEPLTAQSAQTLASRKLEGLAYRVVAMVTIYDAQVRCEGMR